MALTKFVALECQISRGGFSDERVFSLKNIKHQGVCSRRYLWKSDGTLIEDGEPPIGETISGLVAARVIDVQGKSATVSIPDGEVVEIPIEYLRERPHSKVEENVSV